MNTATPAPPTDHNGHVTKAGRVVGTVTKDRHYDRWHGAPLNANTVVFLRESEAIAYVLNSADLPPRRFVLVREDEHYGAGMRHVSHVVGAPLHCAIVHCRERKPLVTLQELIGGAGDYRPAELRAIAAKLISMAEDAETHPMGKRSFTRSYRRY